MNRREMIVNTVASIVGVATVNEIAAEPEPLALVLTLAPDICADDEEIEQIRLKLEEKFKGVPHGRVLVLPYGCTFEAIRPPRP